MFELNVKAFLSNFCVNKLIGILKECYELIRFFSIPKFKFDWDELDAVDWGCFFRMGGNVNSLSLKKWWCKILMLNSSFAACVLWLILKTLKNLAERMQSVFIFLTFFVFATATIIMLWKHLLLKKTLLTCLLHHVDVFCFDSNQCLHYNKRIFFEFKISDGLMFLLFMLRHSVNKLLSISLVTFC